jgi:SPP1 gp7 family putative phage head morphogenesis protein
MLAVALGAVLSDVMERGGNAGATELRDILASTDAVVSFRFDVTNPDSLAYASERAAQLVADVGDSVREALRDAITRAFAEQRTVDETADLIRTIAGFGLDSRWATAVDRYRDGLAQAGYSDARITELVDAYANRLLDARAERIARTEVIDSEMQGRLESWRQAGEAGLFDTNLATKVWMTAEDDRTSDDCDAMDGEEVPWDGEFSSGDDAPPLHPACRCSCTLSPDGAISAEAS